MLWFSVRVPVKDGAGEQLEVGCKLSYETDSPIFQVRPIDHAQDQSPHLRSRRSQLISGRSSTPEAHPSTSTNLQGLSDHCPSCPVQAQTSHSLLWVLPVCWIQPRANQCEHKAWIGGSGLLNPSICPCRHPMGTQHRSVSFPCSHHRGFAGSRDHHGCPADTTHWCYFNLRYFSSLHGGKKQIQDLLHLVRNGCLFREPNEVIAETRCPHTPFNTHLPETIMEWNDPSPSAAVWYNQECFCLLLCLL